MGVYIKGMEMPDRCFSCPMHDTNCCGISKGSYIEYREVDVDVAIDRRPDWCPLIPVPEHGRLIDADALDCLSWNEADETDFKDGVLFVLDKLDSLPTIPAADVVPGSDFRDCRNELCLRCGQYKTKHLGSCDGCRWEKI